MRRKSFFMALGIFLLLIGSIGAALVLLLRYEPSFYERAAALPGPERKKYANEFVSESTNLLNGVVNKYTWESRFTEQQINSYFEEDFLTKHSLENPLPPGISDPRISLDADRIRIGFRYGSGLWSTVVSVCMRVWLVNKEPNVVALEFESLRAGALPMSAQSMLERVTEMAQQWNIEVDWYRRSGHPVVLLRFQPDRMLAVGLQSDRSNPSFLLQQLELRPGMLRIMGRSLDGVQRVSVDHPGPSASAPSAAQ